jgi:hypothetical protein
MWAGVVSGPSVQAMGESIGGRRCAPGSWRLGEVDRIADPLTESAVTASCYVLKDTEFI